MNHGSFFTGIGGFDLAAQWIGWNNVFQVEKDENCIKLLNKRFPNVKKYKDIKDFQGQAGSADIVSGGFPCQPFSVAGKRQGSTDDRYLWPQMFRVIQEIKPTYVVGENVAGLVSMENDQPFHRWVFNGMESKNYFKGKYCRHFYRKRQFGILNQIIEDLTKEQYTVETFIIPAASVGAWHRRDRIWIVAYASHILHQGELDIGKNTATPTGSKGKDQQEGEDQNRKRLRDEFRTSGEITSNTKSTKRKSTSDTRRRGDGPANIRKSVSNTNSPGCKEGQLDRQSIPGSDRKGRKTSANKSTPESCGETMANTNSSGFKEQCRTEPAHEEVDRWKEFKRGSQWEIEPGLGRVVDGVPNRVDRLRGLGNAIVPQVAYEIFKAIDDINNQLKK